jgi:pyruvate formate lyase activating enzyme
MTLEIKGFIETSLVDWDGKIVSVVFLPGCNFRCPYCQNSGLIAHPEKFNTIPEEKIFAYLESHKPFIDGVCITGGEPTLQKNNGLTDLIKRLKKDGFLVKLDTNGTDPEYLKELIASKLVDFVAMDIKAPLEDYTKTVHVKVDTAPVKKSIDMLINSGIDHEFRTTVVPTLIGLPEMEKIAVLIKGAKKFAIQQFEPDHCDNLELRKIKPFEMDTIDKMKKIMEPAVGKVIYRGK